MPYLATIKKPFYPPTTQEGGSLRLLLRKVRVLVVTGPHGTSADVEHIERDERMQVARYENQDGKLRKIL